MKKYENIVFKTLPEHDLYMDISVPENVENPPLIMWIHGGGWNALNRFWSILIDPMLERGYAVATVEYRYSDEAPFPAQMFDLKDALLFLKKNGEKYGYDSKKIIVSGDSAGGHLACMVGVSVGNKAWEKEGEDYSVQAVVDFCGPSWLSFGSKPETHRNNTALEALLGVPETSKEYLAKAAAASPVTYINGSEPPFLILHGSADELVSPIHPRKLRNTLEENGVDVHMYYVPGGNHGLYGNLINDIIAEFLDYYIKGTRTVITPEVLPEHHRTLPIKK